MQLQTSYEEKPGKGVLFLFAFSDAFDGVFDYDGNLILDFLYADRSVLCIVSGNDVVGGGGEA